MRVTNAFLANYAEAKGGIVYASGCFPEWFAGPALPTIAQFFLVLQAELEENEVDPEGRESGQASSLRVRNLLCIPQRYRPRVWGVIGQTFDEAVKA